MVGAASFQWGTEMPSNDEIHTGMIWMLAHWLLPAKASKEDAQALIDEAWRQYKTGLDLKERNPW